MTGPLKNFQLTVEFDGSDFNGWQIQKKGLRTVQGELEKILKILFKKKVCLTGCGRTDAGVHALGHISNFKVGTQLSLETIQRALNAHLPSDIVVTQIKEVPLNFHAQFDARDKTYRYSILNRPYRTVYNRKFVLHFPYKLDLLKMRNAAKNLLGYQDFRSFMASDPAYKLSVNMKNTKRTIKKINIHRKGELVYIDIIADGFLYKMARNITGTLLDVGTNRIQPSAVKLLLTQKDRRLLSATAPAHGLCLLNVNY